MSLFLHWLFRVIYVLDAGSTWYALNKVPGGRELNPFLGGFGKKAWVGVLILSIFGDIAASMYLHQDYVQAYGVGHLPADVYEALAIKVWGSLVLVRGAILGWNLRCLALAKRGQRR